MTKFFKVIDIGTKKFAHYNVFLGLSEVIVSLIHCVVH